MWLAIAAGVAVVFFLAVHYAMRPQRQAVGDLLIRMAVDAGWTDVHAGGLGVTGLLGGRRATLGFGKGTVQPLALASILLRIETADGRELTVQRPYAAVDPFADVPATTRLVREMSDEALTRQ